MRDQFTEKINEWNQTFELGFDEMVIVARHYKFKDQQILEKWFD